MGMRHSKQQHSSPERVACHDPWAALPLHHSRIVGDVPSVVSESTASSTELSEFFHFVPRRVPARELSEFLSACYLCVKANSLSSWRRTQ